MGPFEEAEVEKGFLGLDNEVAKELRLSPIFPRLPPIALGVSGGMLWKSGRSTVMTLGSGLGRTTPRPPSWLPWISFSRTSVTSLPCFLEVEEETRPVETEGMATAVGTGTVAGDPRLLGSSEPKEEDYYQHCFLCAPTQQWHLRQSVPTLRKET